MKNKREVNGAITLFTDHLQMTFLVDNLDFTGSKDSMLVEIWNRKDRSWVFLTDNEDYISDALTPDIYKDKWKEVKREFKKVGIKPKEGFKQLESLFKKAVDLGFIYN